MFQDLGYIIQGLELIFQDLEHKFLLRRKTFCSQTKVFLKPPFFFLTRYHLINYILSLKEMFGQLINLSKKTAGGRDL